MSKESFSGAREIVPGLNAAAFMRLTLVQALHMVSYAV